MNNPTMSSKQINITNLTVCVSKQGIIPQYIRPWTPTDVTEVDYNTTIEEYATFGHNFPNVPMSAKNAGTIGSHLVGLDDPTEVVPLRGGWNQRRLRISLSVSTIENFGTVNHQISAYTDRAEISTTGLIDPDTEFHITAFTEDRVSATNTPRRQSSQAVLSSSHYEQGSSIIMERPLDIFSQNYSDHIPNVDSSGVTHLSKRALCSDMRNINPVKYIGEIVSSGLGAIEENSAESSAFMLLNNSHEVPANRNRFIQAIDQGGKDASFKMKDLMAIFPGCNSPDTYTRIEGELGESEDHGIISMESSIGHQFINSISEWMSSMSITFVAGMVTPQIGEEPYSIHASHMNCPQAQGHAYRIAFNTYIRELVRILTLGDSFTVSISFHINLTYDASIEIQIDQGIVTPLRVPVSMLAVYNPVLSTNADNLGDMSALLTRVMEDVGDVRNSMETSMNPSFGDVLKATSDAGYSYGSPVDRHVTHAATQQQNAEQVAYENAIATTPHAPLVMDKPVKSLVEFQAWVIENFWSVVSETREVSYQFTIHAHEGVTWLQINNLTYTADIIWHELLVLYGHEVSPTTWQIHYDPTVGVTYI